MRVITVFLVVGLRQGLGLRAQSSGWTVLESSGSGSSGFWSSAPESPHAQILSDLQP